MMTLRKFLYDASIALALVLTTADPLAGQEAPAPSTAPTPAPVCAPPSAATITVIDGDTVEYCGERWRLMGYDTPEVHGAKCGYERILGETAAYRLRVLIGGGAVTLTSSGRRDRYGRILGTLTAGGRDVGVVLIGEGLAHVYSGGKRLGWCGG